MNVSDAQQGPALTHESYLAKLFALFEVLDDLCAGKGFLDNGGVHPHQGGREEGAAQQGEVSAAHSQNFLQNYLRSEGRACRPIQA